MPENASATISVAITPKLTQTVIWGLAAYYQIGVKYQFQITLPSFYREMIILTGLAKNPHMIVDCTHTGGLFGRSPKSVLLLFSTDNPPKIHSTAVNDDVDY